MVPCGRGAQADRDRDGLVVVEQQRRQMGARAEPVPGDPAGRFDRISEVAQLVDIAAHGADVDPQFGGQA